jgi:tetratricopeptide (TPR) repeat protein
MRRIVLLASVACGVTVFWSPGVAGDRQEPAQTLEATTAAAFDAAFNLDRDRAMGLARQAVARWPDASRSHRTLAAILWLDLLFERGALSVDHYLESFGRSERARPKPPPHVEQEFQAEIGRAIALAEAALRKNPADLRAKYDYGAAYAVQASYVASVRGSLTAAFRSAKRAYDAQEHVLERDPSRVGAGAVVGIYRYAVSIMGLPTRMLAYMAGFGGGKERGIALLRGAAADRSETRHEAKAALVLILSREGRHLEALQLLAELERQFPRNRLFVLEQGAAAIRAGRFGEAEAVLRRGMNALGNDPRPRIPGEQALWRYKHAVSLIGLGRHREAAGALAAALNDGPPDWVRGRIHLALGQAADASGQRPKALPEYETARRLCRAASDPWCTVRAERHLKQPFRLAS